MQDIPLHPHSEVRVEKLRDVVGECVMGFCREWTLAVRLSCVVSGLRLGLRGAGLARRCVGKGRSWEGDRCGRKVWGGHG